MIPTNSNTRGTKISQACESCRSLKVRCLPSSQAGICKKCIRSGAECIFADPRPRRRTSKPSSKARVSELESKLNELIARVDQSHPSQHSSVVGLEDTSSTSSTLRSQEAYSTGPTTASVAESRPEYNLPFDFYSEYPRINANQSVPCLLSECSVPIATADHYLLRFRSMSPYFPFIVIPDDATFLSLSMDRPFLCLAAVCAAASTDKLLQSTLEQSFRIAILQKIMVCNPFIS